MTHLLGSSEDALANGMPGNYFFNNGLFESAGPHERTKIEDQNIHLLYNPSPPPGVRSLIAF